jgi:hypothetical protein
MKIQRVDDFWWTINDFFSLKNVNCFRVSSQTFLRILFIADRTVCHVRLFTAVLTLYDILQISHLNTKIVEDSEELASSQRATDNMRDNFHKQVGVSLV